MNERVELYPQEFNTLEAMDKAVNDYAAEGSIVIVYTPFGEIARTFYDSIEIAPHGIAPCPRCWKAGIPSNHDGLCDRCCDVLVESFPDHESVPRIKAALQAQRERWCA